MSVQRVFRRHLHYFAIFLSSLFLAGCAARLPSTLPVSSELREEILASYQSFRKNDCSTAVDADISLEIESFGRHLQTSGMLQILPPSLLRTTILDRVGRPLFLMVGAGDTFTLVNSMQGEVLIGSVASITRDSGEPLDLDSGEVVSLLTGSFTPAPSSIRDIRLDSQADGSAWLVSSAAQGNTHNILFNSGTKHILRHAISDAAGSIVLDLRYGWDEINNVPCPLPASVVMTGAALGGTVTLRYDMAIRKEELPRGLFQLTLPEHYIIKRKE